MGILVFFGMEWWLNRRRFVCVIMSSSLKYLTSLVYHFFLLLKMQKNKNAAAFNQVKDDATSELPFDLKSVTKNDAKSLKSLDEHLASTSYISGFEPTSADNLVFEAIANSAKLNGYPNLLRWHKHIESFGNERKQFAVKLKLKLKIMNCFVPFYIKINVPRMFLVPFHHDRFCFF